MGELGVFMLDIGGDIGSGLGSRSQRRTRGLVVFCGFGILIPEKGTWGGFWCPDRVVMGVKFGEFGVPIPEVWWIGGHEVEFNLFWGSKSREMVDRRKGWGLECFGVLVSERGTLGEVWGLGPREGDMWCV